MHGLCEGIQTKLQQHHKEKARLTYEKKAKEEEIKFWQQKCEDLQISKYGKLVDLDVLEQEADRARELDVDKLLDLDDDDLQSREQETLRDIATLEDENAAVRSSPS